MKKNRRIQSFALLILAAVLLAVIAVLGSFWQEAAIRTDFTRKNLWRVEYHCFRNSSILRFHNVCSSCCLGAKKSLV